MFMIMSSLEILALNLYHTHLLSKKKYSDRFVFFALLFITLSIILLMLVLQIEPEGSVRSVLIGGTFIIPLYFLYDMSFKKLFTIMVYCWTYTLTLHTFAYGLIHILNIDQTSLYIFILQTILMAATFFLLIKFSKARFKAILEKANKQNQNLLCIFGVTIFLLIVFLRYFILPNNYIYLALLFLVMVIAITSYQLMFAIVETKSNLTKVNSLVYKDQLTQINNRYALYQDIDQWMLKEKSFRVFFIDVNRLKSINDKYSHQVGDQYLKEFSKSLQTFFNSQSEVYRFAGDEFVVLTKTSIDEKDIEKLKYEMKQSMEKLFEYHGFCIGQSIFPDDGIEADVLIHCADQIMYLEKSSQNT
jgi:diguanylate cyclase (GGDEF)-like protein